MSPRSYNISEFAIQTTLIRGEKKKRQKLRIRLNKVFKKTYFDTIELSKNILILSERGSNSI